MCIRDSAYIVEKGLPLTLDSLREAAANRTSGTAASESQTVGTVASPEAQSEDAGQSNANESYTPKGQQLLTARRQLEEIRLAMTVEANSVSYTHLDVYKRQEKDRICDV